MSDRTALIRLGIALVLMLLIGWGLGEVAMSATQASDLDAVRDLAVERTSTATALARALSTLGSGYVMFPLTILVAVACYAAGRRAAAVAIALSMTGAVLIANVDKWVVGRARPPVHHLEAVTSASFPSGHTSQATALSVSLVLMFLASHPRRLLAVAAATVAGLLIVGVAWSRVYLAVHYPSDVAGGFLLAGVWSLIVAALCYRARRSGRIPTGSSP